MKFKDKYKEELDSIVFSESFEKDTLGLLLQAKREANLMSEKRKPFKIAVLVAAAVLLLSFSTFAVVSLLSASQVAQSVGEKELAQVFVEKDFTPQTVTGEVYSVTSLGMAPGKNIYELEGAQINENRSYAVWAVYRNDSEPLSLIDGSPIQVAPVIDGYRPSLLWEAGMGATGMEKDGVLYYLFDYTDLEAFADKKVSLMAFEGNFPTADILTSDVNGKVVYADTYNGFKGVFELELDKSKADPEKAQEILGMY